MSSKNLAGKINWLDSKIWKQCFISTFICLIGCSIGVIGVSFYFSDYNITFLLLTSLIAGFISCMLFMIFWETLFHKMTFKEAAINSYKMSFVSILIIMLTENFIILFLIPKFSAQQMQMDMGIKHDFGIMLIAMGFGILLALPYNYYQWKKKGSICHIKRL